GRHGNKKKEIVIPPEKAALKIIISLFGTLLAAGLYYYLMLPPVNFKAYEFYIYLAAVIGTYIGLTFVTTKAFAKPEYVPYVKKRSLVPGILLAALALVVGVGFIISTPFFRAKSYSKIIDVDVTGNFTEEIERQNAESYSNIPRLDEAAAANVASRALSDLEKIGKVSQFTVYPLYTQINYRGKPVRVSTLQYANLIKWFTNRSDGFPGYTIIDMADQTTRFVELKEIGQDNIKYSPAEHFGRLLKRHLRFNYPTYIFSDPTFEIDDDGTPYWICARLDKTIGLFGGTDVVGAVFVRANDSSGTSTYYTLDELKNKPELQWVDRIFSADLLVEQYNYYGKYQNGFWNSVLGQKDVFATTEGYSYIAKDDDVYMYTGVTSVTSDQSITGFVLINQRTKASTFYRVSGAKEHSAMAVAEGKVKDKAYVASFPLLINVSGEPTYFMALKDNDNVNQQFAMVNVKNFNKLFVVGENLTDCLRQYNALLVAEGISVDINVEDIDETGKDKDNTPDEFEKVQGKVAEIKSAVLSGESHYYIRLEGSAVYYTIAASKAPEVVILNVGDDVEISFNKADESARLIKANTVKFE
ncbi:MAG TPA: CvpA family protein, partial [Clostridiales bacterium]|nr:CvpA family protein [Clostridiales bacterium]